MLAESLVEILVCPRSKQPLVYFPRGETDDGRAMLVCPAARLRYRVEDDVPILLAEEAEELSGEVVERLIARARELGLRIPPDL